MVSGSDDGRVFLWDRKTGKLEQMLKGDEDVVNCYVGHPYDFCLATSGIEVNVKLWQPIAGKPFDVSEAEEVLNRNRERNNSNEAGIRLSILRNFLFRQFINQQRNANQEGQEEDEDSEENAVNCQTN